MPCVHPIHGFRAPGGQVRHSRAGAWEDRPQTISCGQCIECLLTRSRHAAARIVHESQLHDENAFLTLTLEDKHLGDFQSLDVRHWQLFAHRLRKAMAPQKLRFYTAGEYSDWPRRRPHYHSCVNIDFHWDRVFFKDTDQGHKIYTSKTLDDLWKLGKCFIAQTTFESAAYTARYMMKKITGPNAEHFYKNVNKTTGEIWNVIPEFTTQSRRPGLGKHWIDKFYPEVYGNRDHLRDEIVINGRKMRPPKYYDQQLEKIDPYHFKLIKAKRIKAALDHQDDNTTERLIVKEKCAFAKFSQLQRTLE